LRIYSVRIGETSHLAVKEAGGGYILLQRAYEEWLLESGTCPTREGAKRIASAVVPDNLVSLIESGTAGADACQAAIEFAKRDGSSDAPWRIENLEVTLGAPLTTPRKFICIGLNYREHARESNQEIPGEPLFFNKFATSIVGPYDDVVHQGPPVTEKLDYEVELGVIIAKPAKNVPVERAEEYIFGYTVVNDISARDLQRRDGQWVKGKALDTYAPLGPCVVTKDAIDPGNLRLSTWVNGELRQDSSTSDLIFSVPELIAYLSRLMTLEPGDIISTGTPSGVGGAMNPPRFMFPGDIVECEVEGIGILRNRIVSA